MQVMLAATASDTEFSYPLIASPKVDGFRAYVSEGRMRARSNKFVANLATDLFFRHPALENFDGELVVGPPNAKDLFQVTTSALRRAQGKPESVFLVFDYIDESLSFEMRLAKLDKAIAALPEQYRSRVVKMAQVRIESRDELLEFEERCLAAGFEGIIVRSPSGRYKQGRSTVNEQGMLKLKRFSDAEAIVIGVEEEVEGGTKRAKGTLGALLVRDIATGVEFSIGTGFSAAQRQHYWRSAKKVVGQVVKYKFFKVGMVTAPRFPSFVGFRAAEDM